MGLTFSYLDEGHLLRPSMCFTQVNDDLEEHVCTACELEKLEKLEEQELEQEDSQDSQDSEFDEDDLTDTDIEFVELIERLDFENKDTEDYKQAEQELLSKYRSDLDKDQSFCKRLIDIYDYHALEKDNQYAMNYMGILYHNALGVPRDLAKAAEYYGAAIEMKNSYAAMNMGKLLLAYPYSLKYDIQLNALDPVRRQLFSSALSVLDVLPSNSKRIREIEKYYVLSVVFDPTNVLAYIDWANIHINTGGLNGLNRAVEILEKSASVNYYEPTVKLLCDTLLKICHIYKTKLTDKRHHLEKTKFNQYKQEYILCYAKLEKCYMDEINKGNSKYGIRLFNLYRHYHNLQSVTTFADLIKECQRIIGLIEHTDSDSSQSVTDYLMRKKMSYELAIKTEKEIKIDNSLDDIEYKKEKDNDNDDINKMMEEYDPKLDHLIDEDPLTFIRTIQSKIAVGNELKRKRYQDQKDSYNLSFNEISNSLKLRKAKSE